MVRCSSAKRAECGSSTLYYHFMMSSRATATISAIIVDDEQLACDELAFLLKDFSEIEVVATGKNGLDAHQIACQEQRPKLHRRCTGRDIRDHQRRPHYRSYSQRRRRIELPYYRRTAIEPGPGHFLARPPVVPGEHQPHQGSYPV